MKNDVDQVVSGLKELLNGYRAIEALSNGQPDSSHSASLVMTPLNFMFEDSVQELRKFDSVKQPATRMLEIALEGYQGIEQLGRENVDTSGASVSQALRPINAWVEKLISEFSNKDLPGRGTLIDINDHR